MEEEKKKKMKKKDRTLEGTTNKTPESWSRGAGLTSWTLGRRKGKKAGMLKSSTALDRFHWILKMKRRVGDGAGVD